jgi:monoamine oxidase
MVTNWGTDPFFQGSYTYFPVKAFSEEGSWDNFIKPVGPVHFAGEAFDEKYSGFI